MSRQPPARGTITPMPHPAKIKKCSIFNENLYQDYIWCEEKENAGPDNRRPVERPHPRHAPLKLRNVRFSMKIDTKIIFGVRKRKMLVPTTADPWDDHTYAPPPLKLRNVRFSTKIGTKTIFGARKRKMLVPTTALLHEISAPPLSKVCQKSDPSEGSACPYRYCCYG